MTPFCLALCPFKRPPPSPLCSAAVLCARALAVACARRSSRSTSPRASTLTLRSSWPTPRTCATGTSRACPATHSAQRTASWSRAARGGRSWWTRRGSTLCQLASCVCPARQLHAPCASCLPPCEAGRPALPPRGGPAGAGELRLSECMGGLFGFERRVGKLFGFEGRVGKLFGFEGRVGKRGVTANG
eukprot:353142-Chlamydomonas_euryale.AAC.2